MSENSEAPPPPNMKLSAEESDQAPLESILRCLEGTHRAAVKQFMAEWRCSISEPAEPLERVQPDVATNPPPAFAAPALAREARPSPTFHAVGSADNGSISRWVKLAALVIVIIVTLVFILWLL